MAGEQLSCVTRRSRCSGIPSGSQRGVCARLEPFCEHRRPSDAKRRKRVIIITCCAPSRRSPWCRHVRPMQFPQRSWNDVPAVARWDAWQPSVGQLHELRRTTRVLSIADNSDGRLYSGRGFCCLSVRKGWGRCVVPARPT